MKKHAYLIIAHNNWKILERLLILLDDNRNDIYLHIDRKSDLINFSNNVQALYLQPIITQYFIDNKSEIWLLFLIAHSKR